MSTFSLVLGANAITITKDPVGNNIAGSTPKKIITHVTGIFNQKPLTAQSGEWGYYLNTMTVLIIVTNDGATTSLELQECSNQPTWSTGTNAGVQQAIADINAWNV